MGKGRVGRGVLESAPDMAIFRQGHRVTERPREMKWDRLAEHQIRKAEAEGQFAKLKGAGKPLKPEMGDSADAVGFRIMHEAGVVPREIELRRDLDALKAQLAQAPEGAERDAIARALAEVQLRLDIEQEARRKYMRQK